MPPLTVMVKPVSMRCNMACGYCFYSDVAAHRAVSDAGVMSFDALEVLLRRAFAYAEGELSLMFQGGEPTLAGAAFYEKVLQLEERYARPNLKVSNVIQTNGLYISPELLDILERGRFLVGVSCDGPAFIHDPQRPDAAGRPTHGSVVHTLELLQSRGIDCNVLCVVTRESASHAHEIFEHLAPYGYLQFIPCMEPLDGASDSALSAREWGRFLCELFDLYFAAWLNGKPVSVRLFDNYVSMIGGLPPESCAMCGQCQPSYVVEADGSVYPCDFYCTDEYKLGNVLRSGFYALAKSPAAGRFRAQSVHVPEQCRTCKWHPLCRNGCRRERDASGGGAYGLWRWCESSAMLFEHAYARMERMSSALIR